MVVRNRVADGLILARLDEIGRPARVKLSAMRPSPEVPDAIRALDFYHGVDNDEAAHKILSAGRLEPSTYGHGALNGRGWEKPRPDKVYLTARSDFAAKHALSGDDPGIPVDPHALKRGRHGYIFKVSGRDLNNVEADEDSVSFTYMNTHDGGGVHTWGFHQGLADLGKRVLSPADHDTALRRSFVHRVRVAKKIIPHMPPEMHHDLILNQGAHVAHGGPVKITGAWRIDKTRSPEYRLPVPWSDIFPGAEPLHHLIGKGLK